MTDIDWDSINDLAQRVGRQYAAQWPGIEAEDISQEVLTGLVERPEVLKDYPASIRLVRAAMGRLAGAYCSHERYAYTVMSARWLYTPAEVRSLLENGYFDDSLRETLVPIGPDDRTRLIVFENVCVALWDIDAAMERMEPADRLRIGMRFRDGQDYPTDAARKATDRAVDRLTQLLNEHINKPSEDHDGPGARRAGRIPVPA